MLRSRIEYCNGKPFVAVNNELHYPLAYTSYFEECGEYADFVNNGYRMFFVNVSFTDLPINNITGFSPFLTGVFEGDEPDYGEFDNRVSEIISLCPDAFIFPRINIAMPRKWIRENQAECVKTPTGMRESLYSDKFLEDGAKLLLTLVDHIRNASYSDRIVGYQLCGGNTQEWFHHDLAGSCNETGFEKFRKWMRDRYNISDIPVFTKDDFDRDSLKETVNYFGEFSCEMAAGAAGYFTRILKEYIKSEQIVGVFYGYNAYLNNIFWGHHGLRFIINSPYIDFFSSPCGYDEHRELGVAWSDMLPTGSLKAHNKLYFVECDIRTHLTRGMQASRPGRYPDGIYLQQDDNGNKTVWSGPETKELSLSAIRKAFAHQLTKGSGIWWFDMWGGWYHDDDIMYELQHMRDIAQASINKISADYPKAQTVIFIDEKGYFNNPRGSNLWHSVNIVRENMNKSGIPYDFCMVEDAETELMKYEAAIFTAPVPSEWGKKAEMLCKERNIPYAATSPEKPCFTENELREFLVAEGVHCYNSDGNVIYCSNGYLGIHSAKEGNVSITLPGKYKIKTLAGTVFPECDTDRIEIFMKKYDTVFFELI